MRLPLLMSVLLGCLLLAGCPAREEMGSESISSDVAATTIVNNKEMDSDPISAPGEVDYRCKTDADCEIKNVGNCCGYYPACVNKDSATFPEQVKALCEAEGRMSVCGFPELKGCRCVDNRCEGERGKAGAELLQ